MTKDEEFRYAVVKFMSFCVRKNPPLVKTDAFKELCTNELFMEYAFKDSVFEKALKDAADQYKHTTKENNHGR
jgi:hypothetical protein